MAKKPPNLKYRPGKLEDWPIVAGIVATTWGGEDYITDLIWKEWVEDEASRLIVATITGIIAGFGRLTQFGEAEWWLEGVRVSEIQQGKGVGTAIVGQLVDAFMKHGSGTLRCATDSSNLASIGMLEAHKFRHTLSYVRLAASARAGNTYEFYKVGPKAFEHITQYLRYSPMYRIAKFLEHDWVVRSLTSNYIEHILADPNYEVLVWRAFDRLHGVAIIVHEVTSKNMGYRPDSVLYVGYLDAPDDTTLMHMMAALQTLAAERGLQGVRWYLPARAGFEAVAEIDGAALPSVNEMQIFELHRGTSELNL